MKPFKQCTCCKGVWKNLSDLIRDENVQVIGYQPAFSDSYEGLFFFSHRAKECGTTIAIPAYHLLPLYDGPEYLVNMAGSEQCNELCKSFFDFRKCGNECSMRWVREIIYELNNRSPEELAAKLEKIEKHQQCA